jgi:hypothetical protein
MGNLEDIFDGKLRKVLPQLVLVPTSISTIWLHELKDHVYLIIRVTSEWT